VGSSTKCIAEVVGSSPTGLVYFYTSGNGSFSATVCVLTASVCSVTYTPKSPGLQMITAYYSGDAKNKPSHAEFELTVAPKPTYTVVFIESGLPSGVNWTVELGELRETHNTTAITFKGLSAGVYHWNVSPYIYEGPDVRYAANTSSGDVYINGSSSITVQMVYTPEFLLVLAASPPDGGVVSPAQPIWVAYGASIIIDASPATGSEFIGWMPSTQLVVVANLSSKATLVKVFGPATLTALFQQVNTQSSITTSSMTTSTPSTPTKNTISTTTTTATISTSNTSVSAGKPPSTSISQTTPPIMPQLTPQLGEYIITPLLIILLISIGIFAWRKSRKA